MPQRRIAARTRASRYLPGVAIPPAVHVEPDLARWRDMLDWMLPRTHLLKISAEDLQLLLPGTSPDDRLFLRAIDELY